MALHNWRVSCPTCGKECTINTLQFSADGRIHLDLLCIVCGIMLTYDNSWEKIVIACWEKDNKQFPIVTEVSGTLQ